MVRLRGLIYCISLVIAAGSGGCVVRGQGTVGIRPAAYVVYEQPPPPRVEPVSVRPGFVWIRGRWVWMNGQWRWNDGHWERERAGYAWSEGQWEQRGNQWVWVDGRWTASSQPPPMVQPTRPAPNLDNAPGGVIVSGSGGAPPPPRWNAAPAPTDTAPGGVVVSGGGQWPTSAPPPLRAERPGTRTGFIWIEGHWDWRAGNWTWIDGHWERERANRMWVAGRWESQGNRWIWIDGRWEVRAAQPAGPIIRDHR